MNIKTIVFLFLFIISCTKTERKIAGSSEPNPEAVVASKLPLSGGSPKLTLMSWNMKHLGRRNFDPRQASAILSEADVVAFQEVNKTESGLDSLQGMAQYLSELTKERICMAVSEVPSDSRERYAYIWKDHRISYVKTDGEVMEHCPSTALTIRLGVKNARQITREPAFGTFYFKPTGKLFVYATIHLVPAKKKPGKEIRPLFDTFAEVAGPVVIGGDYNLDSSYGDFEAARTLGFQPSMMGVKTSLSSKSRTLSRAYDNFWFKNMKLLSPPRVINLYDVFTEKSQKEIYDNFSDHCPIIGQFELP